MNYSLKPPQIEWRGNTPVSTTYGDVYFCENAGLAETETVFLDANQLPQRFAQCRHFAVGETGFGSGLNFLATWRLWRDTAPTCAVLHYIAVEQSPLDGDILRRAHAQWPELDVYSRQLVAAYPHQVPGFHRIWLEPGRVCLTLCFGEASQQLSLLNARVDAWFLDGFAPARNPDMWTPALFEQIARTTVEGGTFATFTAAGAVRRGLQAVGFEVERRPGFGQKRERLVGRKRNLATVHVETKPWFQLPRSAPGTRLAVAVVGAGLAGCACAYRLALNGHQVTLIDSAVEPASGSSGNLLGIAMPKLSVDYHFASRWNTEGFRLLNQSLSDASIPGGEGVLQLAHDPREQKRQQRVMEAFDWPDALVRACDASEASQLAGVPMSIGGLFYPGGRWLHPPAVCRHWLDAAGDGVKHYFGRTVAQLVRRDGAWSLLDRHQQTIANAEVVVLANGLGVNDLIESGYLQLAAVRGQLTYLRSAPTSTQLRTAVCFGGYITPAWEGQHCLGATYDRGNRSLTLREQEHRENLFRLEHQIPALAASFTVEARAGGRAAFRVTTQDRLPLVGPVPDAGVYKTQYADLALGRSSISYPVADYLPGLYLSVGHGSRGLVSSVLAAEILASQIDGAPLPVEQDLLDAVHPSRFLVRALQRAEQPSI